MTKDSGTCRAATDKASGSGTNYNVVCRTVPATPGLLNTLPNPVVEPLAPSFRLTPTPATASVGLNKYIARSTQILNLILVDRGGSCKLVLMSVLSLP